MIHSAIDSFNGLSLRRRILAAVLSVSLIGTGIASLAVLNDQLQGTMSHSVIGIDLQAGGAQSFTFAPASWEANSSTTQAYYRSVVLSNAGNTELRYAMTSSATGTQATKVTDVSVYKVPLATDCVAGDPDITGAGGTANKLGTSGTSLGGPTTVKFGDPAQGSQTGDQLLAGGASQVLCFTYFNNASNSATFTAGDSAVQTITFNAESTLNNP